MKYYRLARQYFLEPRICCFVVERKPFELQRNNDFLQQMFQIVRHPEKQILFLTYISSPMRKASKYTDIHRLTGRSTRPKIFHYYLLIRSIRDVYLLRCGACATRDHDFLISPASQRFSMPNLAFFPPSSIYFLSPPPPSLSNVSIFFNTLLPRLRLSPHSSHSLRSKIVKK